MYCTSDALHLCAVSPHKNLRIDQTGHNVRNNVVKVTVYVICVIIYFASVKRIYVVQKIREIYRVPYGKKYRGITKNVEEEKYLE